jgi:regulator of replication initiation timing
MRPLRERMMSDYMKNQGLVDAATGARNSQRRMEKRIEELEAEVERLNSPVILSEWQELEAENAKLREALMESCTCGEFGHKNRCPACTALAELDGESDE